jgi:predicted SAM-dependent methyltransferase
MNTPLPSVIGQPKPDVMPVDREKWFQELHFSNFANAAYQFRDVQRLENVSKILIVGPGQGMETTIFRWRKFQVTTFDIDETFAPDIQGSVDNMPMFRDKEFDVLIASHVLEHLPPAYLDSALAEISRISRYALIYLPISGRVSSLRITPGLRNWSWTFALHLFNWFGKPDANKPKYCGSQHYWEVGRAGFTEKEMRKRFAKKFEILNAYRNPDWLVSMNYVLRARSQ